MDSQLSAAVLQLSGPALPSSSVGLVTEMLVRSMTEHRDLLKRRLDLPAGSPRVEELDIRLMRDSERMQQGLAQLTRLLGAAERHHQQLAACLREVVGTKVCERAIAAAADSGAVHSGPAAMGSEPARSGGWAAKATATVVDPCDSSGVKESALPPPTRAHMVDNYAGYHQSRAREGSFPGNTQQRLGGPLGIQRPAFKAIHGSHMPNEHTTQKKDNRRKTLRDLPA